LASDAVIATEEMMLSIDPESVWEPTTDAEYLEWVERNRYSGFVLNLQSTGKMMFHRADCSHIDRNNTPGVFTERGHRKLCGFSVQKLRQWIVSSGLGTGIGVPRCPRCHP
jgi:hypothetical protein